MKRTGLYIFLSVAILSARAFHIVGGEIEFLYIRDGLYRINLIQYFDNAQDQNPGPDPYADVYIFRNGDNALMSQHRLLLSSVELVEYTNVECSIDELQTSRILYTLEVALEPNEYASTDGYYIQWERCCRNSNVDNILSPDGTGMNYVLEIPPLMKNGQVFINSSPVLFKPLSDYACVNQLYYIEFTGIDPDGDSLVYSLTTPLNSSSQDALPIPQPKPHLNVTFLDGFSEDNMIPGSPPLKISEKGLLTVSPLQTGLYVFAIKVDEYRDREKIGESRRDFQMLVVDGCEPPEPPVVAVSIPGDPDFDPEEDVLIYTVADAKCFDFLVSNISPGEQLSLRAEGVNFDEDLNEIFSISDFPINDGSDLVVEVCIPDCPPLSNEPFILDLIAADNACPLPQMDTVRLTILVEPPANERPIPSFKTLTVVQDEDNDPVYQQRITATDMDNDLMEVSLFVEEVSDPTLFGFDIEVISSEEGEIIANFTWDTDCTIYDFTEQSQFDVKILINDSDQCDVPGDTISINALVVLPPNTDPNVSSSIPLPNSIDLGTTLEFDVTALDTDGDDMNLRFVGENFNPDDFGIEFTDVSGNSSISSTFSWNLECDAERFIDGQQFELLFIADDEDRCKVRNFDTLRHTLTVNYPDNQTPEFEVIDQFRSIRVNEFTRISIEAFDLDNDFISIDFADGFRQPSSASLNLVATNGEGRAATVLEWQPECSLLRVGETSTLQDVVIQVTDNACPIPAIDTLKITFEILDDTERSRSFLPPNVFTPNGDGKNDSFKLSGNFEINQNLPPDNCDNHFEYIMIHNRSGIEVFKSENRDFVWSGAQFPAGVYYYYIKYSKTDFKGYIQLVR